MVLVMNRAATWSRPYRHLQDQRDPHEGEEGPDDPEGLLLPLILLFSSRPFVPLLKTCSATNTSGGNKLDVGTFCPNQYKPRVL